MKRLDSANVLFTQARSSALRDTRRLCHKTISIGSDCVVIRDQQPLHAGQIAFEPGWDMRRFVEHVNDHVFFWPGSASRPVESGLNHFERYRNEAVVVLRVPSRYLLADPGVDRVLFSRFNSGAPRVARGVRSPRGAATYVPASGFDGTIKDVVEVVFRRSVALPVGTELAYSYQGTWEPLFDAAG